MGPEKRYLNARRAMALGVTMGLAAHARALESMNIQRRPAQIAKVADGSAPASAVDAMAWVRSQVELPHAENARGQAATHLLVESAKAAVTLRSPAVNVEVLAGIGFDGPTWLNFGGIKRPPPTDPKAISQGLRGENMIRLVIEMGLLIVLRPLLIIVLNVIGFSILVRNIPNLLSLLFTF
jgi:hypothetical protein